MKMEIFQIQNDPISLKEWVFERDNYTCIQLLTKYFSSRKYIFVMECETLTIQASNKVEYPVVVSGHLHLKFLLIFKHFTNTPLCCNLSVCVLVCMVLFSFTLLSLNLDLQNSVPATAMPFFQQIAYNAEGEMMILFIPTKPGFQEVLRRHFKNRVNFFPTDDGKLDKNCLCILMYLINL